jgi:hypothetical protein
LREREIADGSLLWRERVIKVMRKRVYAGVCGRARGSEVDLEVDFSDFSKGGFIVSYREIGRS